MTEYRVGDWVLVHEGDDPWVARVQRVIVAAPDDDDKWYIVTGCSAALPGSSLEPWMPVGVT